MEAPGYNPCCGLDIHKDILVAAFRNNTSVQLPKFRDWPTKAFGSKMTTMESTGSYWVPVWNILEARGIPQMLVNAAEVKAVPGRKTDKADAK